MTLQEALWSVAPIVFFILIGLFLLRCAFHQHQVKNYIQEMRARALAIWCAYDPIEDQDITQVARHPRNGSRHKRKPSTREP